MKDNLTELKTYYQHHNTGSHASGLLNYHEQLGREASDSETMTAAIATGQPRHMADLVTLWKVPSSFFILSFSC